LAKYPLEQLLDLKQQMERMRQLELALAEQARQNQVLRLRALVEALDAELAAPLDLSQLEDRARFTMAQQRLVSDTRDRLRAKAEVCLEVRTLLLNASVERKKFESHKSNHEEETKREQARVQQAFTDEIAGQQFIRKALGTEPVAFLARRKEPANEN